MCRRRAAKLDHAQATSPLANLVHHPSTVSHLQVRVQRPSELSAIPCLSSIIEDCMCLGVATHPNKSVDYDLAYSNFDLC